MSLCILTNNAALFPPAASNGGHLIRALELDVDENVLIAPDVDDFSRAYKELERDFSAILVLAASENILPGASSAQIAAQSHGGKAKISVMDTQQIGPALNILAHIAAQQAADGVSMTLVENYIRAAIPHLFTLLCPDHLPLYRTRNNTNIAAPPEEQPETQRMYTIEEGRLTLYKKIRTQRHLVESMHEFLEEFEKPREIAFFHGGDSNLRARPLREASDNLFPGIHFGEVELNKSMTALFGSQTVGLTVLEI
jgi:fatty acid-binding protein DegV